jgi:hypothetical protein
MDSVLTVDTDGVPSIADKGQKFSKLVSTLLLPKLGKSSRADKSSGQHSGHAFEGICLKFIAGCFTRLEHPDLATALGNEYAIAPDIIISREPFGDEEINRVDHLVDATVARQTPFRKANNDEALQLLDIMIDGKRLRDIADLPLDLLA